MSVEATGPSVVIIFSNILRMCISLQASVVPFGRSSNYNHPVFSLRNTRRKPAVCEGKPELITHSKGLWIPPAVMDTLI